MSDEIIFIELDHDDSKCEKCQKADACDPHLCPYQQDINDDQESMCNCCEDCEQDCSDSR